MRPVLDAARKLAGGPRTDIAGYVERIDPFEILGWAFSQSGKPLDLTVRVDGRQYVEQPEWTERRDVVETFGANARKSGFQIKPAVPLQAALSREGLKEAEIHILANGHSLRKVDFAFRPQHVAGEALGIRTETKTALAAIESWLPFVIRGWAVARGAERSVIEVTVDGKPVECGVVRVSRPDLEEVLGDAYAEAGFEIELPGYLWELADGAESCAISVRIDGHSITPEPLVLSHQKAAQWIRKIAGLGEGHQRQYFGLLALEHLRCGGFFRSLDGEAHHFVRKFARQMRLEQLLSFDDRDQLHADGGIEEDASTLLLWSAMHELNVSLGKNPNEKRYDAIRRALSSAGLRGPARERYLNLAVQITCKSGEFLQLHRSLDLSSLYTYEASSDKYRLSILLPVLAAEKHIVRATAALGRLAAQSDGTWLNTECIHFSLKHVQRLEAEGEIELDEAEKFRFAFIWLLNAFKGEWFSRLHDLELLDAMIAMLADLERYSDDHKCQVVDAAIRNYGLSPTFWERLAARVGALRDDELSRAESAWRRLRDTLEKRGVPPAGRLEEALEPVLYFHRRHNPEALIFLRELVTNGLPELNRALSPTGRGTIDELLAAEPAEAVRIAAFPLEGKNALQALFLEMGERRLFHTLRQLGERQKSEMYELQRDAAVALHAAQKAAHQRDPEVLKSALAEVEKKAIALGDQRALYLGADLMASAYVLAADAAMSTDVFLMRLGKMVRAAAIKLKAGEYLPAAVCSALGRLAARPSNAVLRGFVREMQSLIRDKFGSCHDELFTPVSELMLSLAGTGWPRDTLVVIYSCRKYLDNRIKAIRETWGQDLEARGIPYVVLVGDGDDTLQDGLLALDVSDRYEDLPKKTLKLFEWAYRHTDAQYVVKVDDDCYLDVGRYFDSLSYRKHFYYGRVIRREVGGTDRVWHQSKSHDFRSQRALDKSPEPSIYADGGSGYCLSRVAIAKLLSAIDAEASKRLIARSFMEDKLVGDLLALQFITPSEEDCESYRRQRTFAEAMPVGMWENTFFPSRITPTKLVHLDTERDLASTRQMAGREDLRPKKIWPSSAAPAIAGYSNQLELLTDAKEIQCRLSHDLVVVSVVRNEMAMLPHFLAHYRGIGVRGFIFVDNCSDDGTREYLFGQPDGVLFSADTEYRHSHYGVAWQQAVMGNICLGKWVLLADADELLVYPDCEERGLAAFIAEVEAEGADAVATYMIDMYPYGDLAEADISRQPPFEAAPYFDREPLLRWRLGSGMYSNGPTYVSSIRHRLAELSTPNAFTSQKYALLRYQPWHRYSEGLHYLANARVSGKPAWFAHFKYHSDFKDKVPREVRRGQHFNNAEEYRRYAVMLAEGKGGFGKQRVSTRYAGSSSFSGIQLGELEGKR